MAHCVGSGVPGDWFEHGHKILPGTEQQMFSVKWRRLGSTYFQRRCYLCDSTRRYWRRSKFAITKASVAHRSHARRMVKKALAPSIEIAVRTMNASGLTVAWIASAALAAYNQPCPGRCFLTGVVNSRPVMTEHIITDWNDLSFDWRDPRYPLTPENAGFLCQTCNRQKQQLPWTEFMARQHAIRENYLHGELLPIQAALF